jgi:hypothetical protein
MRGKSQYRKEQQMAAQMETTVRDTLNAGLGLVKSLEQNVEVKVAEIRAQIGAGYTELVSKGAADQSEGVVKLRSLLDQGLAQVKDVRTKIEGVLKNN